MHRVDDDARFLEQCESAGVSRAEWDHTARVRMAYAVLQREDLAGAIARVRRIILRVNSRLGIANAGGSGYHETLTLAWVRVIAAAMSDAGAGADFEAFSAERFVEAKSEAWDGIRGVLADLRAKGMLD